jgi:hypothetical protein
MDIESAESERKEQRKREQNVVEKWHTGKKKSHQGPL